MVEEREFVVPGKLLGEGDFKAGYGTYLQERSVFSSIAGLMTRRGEFINVIPLNGKYHPQEGDVVIGIVSDLTPSSWLMDINGPNPAPMGTSETPWEVDFGATGNFIDLNEVVLLRVVGVDEIKRVQVSMKGPGLKKLTNGILYEIPPPKVPRVIGKSGSMISLLKKYTGCQIVVAQNGRIWIDGPPEGMDIAYKCLDFIHNEAHTSGLTDKVEDFLKKNAPAHLLRKETPEEKPAQTGGESRGGTSRPPAEREPAGRRDERPRRDVDRRDSRRDPAETPREGRPKPDERRQDKDAGKEQKKPGRREEGKPQDRRDDRGSAPPTGKGPEREPSRETPTVDKSPKEPPVRKAESPLDATREEMRREMEQKGGDAPDRAGSGGGERRKDDRREERRESRDTGRPPEGGEGRQEQTVEQRRVPRQEQMGGQRREPLQEQRREGRPEPITSSAGGSDGPASQSPSAPATPPAAPAEPAQPDKEPPKATGFGAMAPAADRMKQQEKKPGLFGD